MDTALVPYDQIARMAAVLGRNKLFGKTEAELLPLMLIAQAEGKHPAIAAQEYDIIQGRPAINSRAALARFQAAGGRIQWKTRTATEATAIFSHPQGGELSVTWTMERAKRAGLAGKDNWTKYPEAMLSARVVAEGVRAVFPGCLSGMYLGEEVQDFGDLPPQAPQPPERNVTPKAGEAEEPPPEEPPAATARERCLEVADRLKLDAKSLGKLFPEPRDYEAALAVLEDVERIGRSGQWLMGIFASFGPDWRAELKKEAKAAEEPKA